MKRILRFLIVTAVLALGHVHPLIAQRVKTSGAGSANVTNFAVSGSNLFAGLIRRITAASRKAERHPPRPRRRSSGCFLLSSRLDCFVTDSVRHEIRTSLIYLWRAGTDESLIAVVGGLSGTRQCLAPGRKRHSWKTP